MKLAICHQSSVVRILLMFLAIIFYYLLLTTPVIAVESIQSASPSSTLQTKLRELQTEIASRAAEFKLEVSNKLQNKAYVGKIKSKSDNSLILIGKTGDKSVKINEFTEFVIPSKSSKTKPSIKNLEIENYIVAVGDVDEIEVLTAKKIIKVDPPKDIKQIYFGEVLAVNENVITLKTDQNLAVSTNTQTIFKISQKDGTLSNIKIGQKIIVSGIVKDKIIKANLVYSFR